MASSQFVKLPNLALEALGLFRNKFTFRYKKRCNKMFSKNLMEVVFLETSPQGVGIYGQDPSY